MSKVVILMGSLSDKDHVNKITEVLDGFNIEWELRVASAHKTPERIISMAKEYSNTATLFITVAGRSNALSGMVDGLTEKPVIACPPLSSKFAGMDILSSLRMPSGIAPLVVLGPEQCALAAAKIIATQNEELGEKITRYRDENKDTLEKADKEVK